MSTYDRFKKLLVLRPPVEPGLHAAVGVEDHPGHRMTSLHDRHRQRVGDQRGTHMVGHRPADDPPGVRVDHGREVEPALPGADVGHVPDPHRVQAALVEPALDPVERDVVRLRLGLCRGPPRPRSASPQTVGPHVLRDRLARHNLALRAQVGKDPRRPVGAVGVLVQLGDPRRQHGCPHRPRRGRSPGPRVVGRAGDLEQPAHHGDLEGGLLSLDQPVPAHRVCSVAKKAAAFFRNSRSIRRIWLSRRS